MLSIIFITYNRSDLLAIAFEAVKKSFINLKIPVEFIVSDDGSSSEHLEIIKSLGFDKIVLSPENCGLGNNCNKGIKASSGDLILQLQDDWIFVGQPSDLTDAIQVLQSDPEVGIIQLTDVMSDLPSDRRVTPSGVVYDVFINDRLPWNRDCGLRPYSDRPHVKSISFVNGIGSYLEGVAMGIMENDFKRRVATQKRWRVARLSSRIIFIDFESEHSLNPGGKRNELIALLHKIPFAGKWVEQVLRKAWRTVDHLAAIVASRLLG